MKIILNHPVTYAGIAHAVGAEIEVLLHDAEYLVERGVANFKAGVQRMEKDYRSSAAPTVTEPAAADPAETPTDSLTDTTGVHHE